MSGWSPPPPPRQIHRHPPRRSSGRGRLVAFTVVHGAKSANRPRPDAETTVRGWLTGTSFGMVARLPGGFSGTETKTLPETLMEQTLISIRSGAES